MKIKRFSELSEKELDLITNIHYNHWSKFNPLMDKEDTFYKFKHVYNGNNLPFGIALYNENNLIGFCTLRLDNLKDYPNLNPWICSVMILEEYRHQGYGRKLICYAKNILKELGYNQAYLWTDQAPDFYLKIGFTFMNKFYKENGEEASLFSINL